MVATFVTLFIVPVVYSRLRKAEPTKHRLDAEFEKESSAMHTAAWSASSATF